MDGIEAEGIVDHLCIRDPQIKVLVVADELRPT